jgi:hypothetical protein
MVSAGVSSGGGKDEEASRLLIGQYLGLFSRHNETHRAALTCSLLARIIQPVDPLVAQTGVLA